MQRDHKRLLRKACTRGRNCRWIYRTPVPRAVLRTRAAKALDDEKCRQAVRTHEQDISDDSGTSSATHPGQKTCAFHVLDAGFVCPSASAHAATASPAAHSAHERGQQRSGAKTFGGGRAPKAARQQTGASVPMSAVLLATCGTMPTSGSRRRSHPARPSEERGNRCRDMRKREKRGRFRAKKKRNMKA